MVYGAVDLLASEYGWSYRDILYRTYPEDFFLLQRQIRMRKVDEAIMQLSIISNPYKEADEQESFVKGLMANQRFMRGEPDRPDELDIEAFEGLRTGLKNKSKTIKVK